MLVGGLHLGAVLVCLGVELQLGLRGGERSADGASYGSLLPACFRQIFLVLPFKLLLLLLVVLLVVLLLDLQLQLPLP